LKRTEAARISLEEMPASLIARGCEWRPGVCVSAGDVPWVCAISVEEINRGIRPGEARMVRRLLEALRVAPLGRDEGERAGAWRREYAAQGVTLSRSDCLIAAAAISVNASLATGNPRDFPMAEVDVDHWPVGA
jgi:predicted nucleic acid-binding protein